MDEMKASEVQEVTAKVILLLEMLTQTPADAIMVLIVALHHLDAEFRPMGTSIDDTIAHIRSSFLELDKAFHASTH